MARKPKAKKPKPTKPDFVFPPGGAAIAPIPGLRLKPRTGDVPRWWPNDKPGKAPFACNVPGVNWSKTTKTWIVMHTNVNGKYTGTSRQTFLEACTVRAAMVDGISESGKLLVLHGELCVSSCGHNCCKSKNISVVNFAPDPFMYKKSFAKFQDALQTLAIQRSASALAVIEKLRRSHCLSCRTNLHSSRMSGANSEYAKCIRMAQHIKTTWSANKGCTICGCCDTDVLQGDHVDRQGKEEIKQALDAAYWAHHGGAQAMIEHYLGDATTVQPICMYCHFLQPSHQFYKSTPIEELTKEMKTRRKTLLEKRTYVNDYKVSKKICEHPMCRDPLTNVPRVITFANAHAFQCAHVEDVDKEYTISSLVVNGQTLKTAKPAIDRELPKCKIYCANCHHLYDTIPRRKEGRELLDALLARGAPVCVECE